MNGSVTTGIPVLSETQSPADFGSKGVLMIAIAELPSISVTISDKCLAEGGIPALSSNDVRV